ncbi:hypothetical protein BU26DRAFT_583979, partial [Trematosphaeria pertusa]
RLPSEGPRSCAGGLRCRTTCAKPSSCPSSSPHFTSPATNQKPPRGRPITSSLLYPSPHVERLRKPKPPQDRHLPTMTHEPQGVWSADAANTTSSTRVNIKQEDKDEVKPSPAALHREMIRQHVGVRATKPSVHPRLPHIKREDQEFEPPPPAARKEMLYQRGAVRTTKPSVHPRLPHIKREDQEFEPPPPAARKEMLYQRGAVRTTKPSVHPRLPYIKQEDKMEESQAASIAALFTARGETKAQRRARRGAEAAANPLVARLKKDVAEKKVELKAYGHIPKKPRPGWWLETAKKVYKEETKQLKREENVTIESEEEVEREEKARIKAFGVENVRKEGVLRDERKRLEKEEAERRVLEGRDCAEKKKLVGRKGLERELREKLASEVRNRVGEA